MCVENVVHIVLKQKKWKSRMSALSARAETNLDGLTAWSEPGCTDYKI